MVRKNFPHHPLSTIHYLRISFAHRAGATFVDASPTSPETRQPVPVTASNARANTIMQIVFMDVLREKAKKRGTGSQGVRASEPSTDRQRPSAAARSLLCRRP